MNKKTTKTHKNRSQTFPSHPSSHRGAPKNSSGVDRPPPQAWRFSAENGGGFIGKCTSKHGDTLVIIIAWYRKKHS